MTPGVGLPWMLCWLAMVAIPPLLARLSLAHARRVRWAATELVAEAARRGLVTRGGVPLPRTGLRMAMLACAALAAARPMLESHPARAPREAAAAAGNRVEIVTLAAPPGRVTTDPAVALRGAIEALRAHAPGPAFGPAAAARSALEIHMLEPGEAARGPGAPPGLIVLCDGAVPAAGDGRRIADAVAEGAALLVCVGPESLAAGEKERLSAWLESLVGIAVVGRRSGIDGAVEVGPPLAAAVASGGEDGSGFILLPGPRVATVAELSFRTMRDRHGAGAGSGEPPAILARTMPDSRPLLVELPFGRGRVCIATVPLSLATVADDRDGAWSDLAAWPVFVPLVDRLVARLLGQEESPRATAPPAVSVPLAPLLLVIATLLAIADWLFPASRGGRWGSRTAGHGMAVASLMALGWLALAGRGPAPGLPAAPPRAEPARPVDLVFDISPSMAARDATDPSRPQVPATRLSSAVEAFLAGGPRQGAIDRVAAQRPVRVFTAAAGLAALGRYGDAVSAATLRALEPVPPAADASRIGDAVVALLDGASDGDDQPPAAIVVATDGAVTAGRSWGRAARIAASRRVPLVVVPRGADASREAGALPPGFRITHVAAPRSCRRGAPLVVDVRAEAAADFGPLPLAAFADVARWRQSPAVPIATGILLPTSAGGAKDGGARGYAGSIALPAHAFATEEAAVRTASPVLVIGDATAAAAPHRVACATVPVVVGAEPVRVLLVDDGPRYECRFLERVLTVSPGWAVETVLLSFAATPGMRAGGRLPEAVADWNRSDVVVLGDVSFAAAGSGARRRSWEGLRVAVSSAGLGLAWLPGRRWWETPRSSPDWLPAGPAGPALPPTAHTLHVHEGARAAGWFGGPTDIASAAAATRPDAVASVPQVFNPDVFALLGPVRLRPTARVLASALPREAASAAAIPAVFVDRLGAGAVLGHLCETWRWRAFSESAYANYWRHALDHLAEPHRLGRLVAATLDVRPVAPAVGDLVRVDVVPSRAEFDPSGWRLEVLPHRPPGASGDGSTPQIFALSAAFTGGAPTVTIPGLAAGDHTLRLVPPPAADGGRAEVAVSHDIIISPRAVEKGDDPAAIAALEEVAGPDAGAIALVADPADLPAMVATLIDPARPRSESEPPGSAAAGRWQGGVAATQALMLALAFAVTLAWWPPEDAPRGGEGRGR